MMAVITAVTDWFESKLHVISLVGLGLAIVAGLGMAAQLKITTLERDDAKRDVTNLQATIAAKDARYNAVVAAYSKKAGDDHDRQSFTAKNKADAAAARGTNRDGPLAPVGRDFLGRVRERQRAAASVGQPHP